MEQFYVSITPENQLPVRPWSFSYNSLHRCASESRLELQTKKWSALTYLPGAEAWEQEHLSVPGMLRRFLPLGAAMQLVQPCTCPGHNTKGTCKLLCQSINLPSLQCSLQTISFSCSWQHRQMQLLSSKKTFESVRRGNGNPIGSTWVGVTEDHQGYSPFSWCPSWRFSQVGHNTSSTWLERP